VNRTNIPARGLKSGGFAVRPSGLRPHAASPWMAAAFLVCLILAATVLAVFGTGENGIALALRVTARWCFLLFWPAYAAGAMGKLFGARFAVLAGYGREFGLAFAAALLVHVGLVLWVIYIAADQRSLMIFFWVGVLCTYALALSSSPLLRKALGPFLWRTLCTVALEYIALVFAVDFILEPLRQAGGAEKYPLSYLPFAATLVGGVGLRLAAFARRAGPHQSKPARA
jgi:hypothetical protein